jgi:hypothetical protein
VDDYLEIDTDDNNQVTGSDAHTSEGSLDVNGLTTSTNESSSVADEVDLGIFTDGGSVDFAQIAEGMGF